MSIPIFTSFIIVVTTPSFCDEPLQSVDDVVDSETVDDAPVTDPNTFPADFSEESVGDVTFKTTFKRPLSVTSVELTSNVGTVNPEDIWRMEVEDSNGDTYIKAGVS